MTHLRSFGGGINSIRNGPVACDTQDHSIPLLMYQFNDHRIGPLSQKYDLSVAAIQVGSCGNKPGNPLFPVREYQGLNHVNRHH
jgi:hypothetical protein